MEMNRRTFLKYMPLSIAGIAMPVEEKEKIKYKNFQEILWFDDKGKTVFIEKVPIKDNIRVYNLRISKHIGKRV